MTTKKRPPAASVLARNVRSRREALGFTQEELAARARIEAAALSRIENGLSGSRGIGLSRLERLATALRWSTADLFQS